MLTDNKRIARDKNKVHGEAENPHPSHTPNSGRMGHPLQRLRKVQRQNQVKDWPTRRVKLMMAEWGEDDRDSGCESGERGCCGGAGGFEGGQHQLEVEGFLADARVVVA